MAKDDLQWIRDGLAKPGKTKKGLAASLGRHPSMATDLLKGTRKLALSEVLTIARYLEVPPPPIGEETPPPVTDVPLVDWVSAGELQELTAAEALAILREGDLPKGDWIALKVGGDSMDRISPPESVIFVNRKDKRLVANACYVIDDGEGKATYKRFRPGPMRFEPVSTNPEHDPIFPENEPTIIGRVRRSRVDM